MYCQADVVFRGQPTSGSSSLSFDENGNNVSNGRLTFNVEQFYKNNGQSSEVDVVRSYSDADPCEPSFLPESTGSYLVFASGTTFLRVPPCGYVLGEECIPDNLENTSC
ncbi:hypothetical protein BgiMline_029965 [Biomphalaria glabrata]|nr:hypothetical protein BgiMline_026681 [Biomphalaria glabrata]